MKIKYIIIYTYPKVKSVSLSITPWADENDTGVKVALETRALTEADVNRPMKDCPIYKYDLESGKLEKIWPNEETEEFYNYD